MYNARQNRIATLDGNRLQVNFPHHPLANVAASGQRLTPPDSDEEHVRAAVVAAALPSRPSARRTAASDTPSAAFSTTTTRASSMDSDTTAIEQLGHRDTQAILHQLATANQPAPPPAELPDVPEPPLDLEALAELVSEGAPSDHEPSSSDNSDNSDGEGANSCSSNVGSSRAPSEVNMPPPADPKDAWKENCDLVDWGCAVDTPEADDLDVYWLNHTIGGNEYSKFLNRKTPPPALTKPAYTPRGKWSFADGMDMQNVRVVKTLGEGGFTKAYIKQGVLYGEEVTFISKEWNLQDNDDGFFSELALYLSPRYLQDLQGICIPRIIGIFRHRDNIAVAFELPHANSWMEAHPDLPPEVKERIIDAYRKIHEKNILHGDVGLRHILIGDDHKVTIIDFNISRAVEDNWYLRLGQCEPADLERELRELRVKLRCEGAIEEELRLIQETNKLKKIEEAQRQIRRELRRGKKRKAPGDEAKRESMFESSDEEMPEGEICGVDERSLQNEDDLHRWIVTRDLPRRFVVPGQSPDLATLPPYNPNRQEDEVTLRFLKGFESEEKEKEKTPPTDLQASPTPASPQTIWSLPRRVLRRVNLCLSAIIPFSFTSPPSEQNPTPTRETEERPRKRARVCESI